MIFNVRESFLDSHVIQLGTFELVNETCIKIRRHKIIRVDSLFDVVQNFLLLFIFYQLTTFFSDKIEIILQLKPTNFVLNFRNDAFNLSISQIIGNAFQFKEIFHVELNHFIFDNLLNLLQVFVDSILQILYFMLFFKDEQQKIGPRFYRMLKTSFIVWTDPYFSKFVIQNRTISSSISLNLVNQHIICWYFLFIL